MLYISQRRPNTDTTQDALLSFPPERFANVQNRIQSTTRQIYEIQESRLRTELETAPDQHHSITHTSQYLSITHSTRNAAHEAIINLRIRRLNPAITPNSCSLTHIRQRHHVSDRQRNPRFHRPLRKPRITPQRLHRRSQSGLPSPPGPILHHRRRQVPRSASRIRRPRKPSGATGVRFDLPHASDLYDIELRRRHGAIEARAER